ncbi:hypothetical protein FIV00_14930 [Labrenzia sp. THAF82]|uniref:hypothetical protein n=1 Tax=Labrenzia sp. THAF82 TaxID=2587861 RepID=UPI001269260B|nr:hypothetical protein [Labrenzia sp. THAF82]QFT31784.1 hypothetical protein FIV00_14930 [Labrenzia sp. THAF82]
MDELPNGRRFLGDNVTTANKTFVQSSVLDSHPPEMIGRHTLAASLLERQECFDGLDQLMGHERDNARLCVHVYNNERFYVRAITHEELYKSSMSARPIDRIAAAILLSGKSNRSISKSARLGVNAVSQLFTLERMPGQKGLAQLCDALSIDAGWVLTGKPANPKIDEILAIADALSFEEKRTFLKSLSQGDQLSIDEMKKLASDARVSFEALQNWILGSTNGSATPETVAAFDELASIANGNELDTELLMASLEEAYEIERQVYGKLGPASTRAKLVKKIYALKLADTSDS